MARKRSPDRDKAFELWKSSSGSMKLVDIADQLGCKPSQIRKWKSQDKWDDQLKGTVTKQKGTLPKTNSNVTNQKEREKPTVFADDGADKLTAKQEMFVREFLVDLNATQAAKRSGYSEKTAHVIGQENMQKPNVRRKIQQLMNERAERVEINADDVLHSLHRAAFSDIREFVEWGIREIHVYDEEGNPVYDHNGEQKKIEMPFVQLKPMDQIDGRDIAEIKLGRNGLEVKRVDPLKSRELLGRHLKLFTDKHELSGNVTFEQLLEEMDDG